MLWRAMSGLGGAGQRLLAETARLFQRFRARYQSWIGLEVREARGLKLLRAWLSPEQLKQFEATGSFDVIGCASGKRYRIHHGSMANVYEIDDEGGPRVGWCFVPAGHLVAGDVMLAQKIALETNELAANAVANRFPARTPIRSLAQVDPVYVRIRY